MTHIRPRVSVGMPVYNGGKSLAKALDNVLAQTLPAFEIIISDNGSSDETAEICQKYASENPSIRYFRQAETTNATRNFRFVAEQAKGDYFMWSAHDDIRDMEFVERLSAALEVNPNAVLAFGDVVQYFEGTQVPMPFDFEHGTRNRMGRLYWAATSPLHHLYGVWRTASLRRIDWTHTEWWHDTPLMMAAALLGDFIHVPGVRLHYLYNEHPFFLAGGGVTLTQLLHRTGDIFYLVVCSGKTVGKISGIGFGLAASTFALLKVAQQTAVFFGHRMLPRRGTDRRQEYSRRGQIK